MHKVASQAAEAMSSDGEAAEGTKTGPWGPVKSREKRKDMPPAATRRLCPAWAIQGLGVGVEGSRKRRGEAPGGEEEDVAHVPWWRGRVLWCCGNGEIRQRDEVGMRGRMSKCRGIAARGDCGWLDV